MSDTSNDQTGDASPSVPGTQGADNARAYVPPQTLKAKAQPSDTLDEKVLIRAGNDPRKAKTVTKGTLPVNQPIPGEVLNRQVGSVGGPATPFEGHAQPARVDAALPFRQPAVAAPPMVAAHASPGHAGGQPMFHGQAAAVPQGQVASLAPSNGVAAGGGFTPKHPPLQLTSPGVLTSAAGAAPAMTPEPAVAAPVMHAMAAPAMGMPPAAVEAPVPVAMTAVGMAGAPAATGHLDFEAATAPPVAMPPAAMPPAAMPPAAMPPAAMPPAAMPPAAMPPAAMPPMAALAEGPASGPAPISAPPPSLPPDGAPSDLSASHSAPSDDAGVASAADGEHPLAATNSPWTSPDMAEKVDAVDLPSADFLPSANVSKAPSVAPAAVVEAPSGGSRTAMTVGLAVAVLALIGAVVYFTMIDRTSSKKPSDPAKVNVGSEQQDYDMKPDDSPSAATSQAPEAPKPPPPKVAPVIIPKTIPKPPGAQPKRKKPEDIYDGL